jgi:hypothetical protein
MPELDKQSVSLDTRMPESDTQTRAALPHTGDTRPYRQPSSRQMIIGGRGIDAPTMLLLTTARLIDKLDKCRSAR